MFRAALFLFLAAAAEVKCEQLTQPVSVTVQPGQPLTISCQVSYSVTSYWTAWIRQSAGKGLEWIGDAKGSSTDYKDSLRNKFSISTESSSNTVTLKGQNLQPEDTAVYYCARLHSDYFDYWGKGTQVTVTSAIQSAPTVFPLAPCGSGGSDMVTLGCLATGFNPSSITFSWEKGSTALNNVIQYPSIQKGNEYMGISQVQVSRQDWEAKQSFKCIANHPAGQRHASIMIQTLRMIPPKLTLYPVWDGEVKISDVRLICALSDYFPKDISVQWYKEEQLLTSKQTVRNFISANEENTTYSQTTEIIPEKEEWMKGSMFRCKSTHIAKNLTETINICQIYGKDSPPIYMEIPNFLKVMTESEVEAKCSIYTALNAKLTWVMDGVPVEDATYFLLTRNETFVSTTLKVPSETWAKKKQIQCKAEHLCFSATKTMNISGPSVGRPQVEIRRSLSKLLKGESAVFQCDVSQLSPQDLFITFQVNGAATLQKDYIDLPEESGPYSVSRSFSVPTESWKIDTNVSCSVNQGFSSSTFKSNLMSRIFVNPSVELLLVPSGASGQQTLLCSGWGFDPQIEWFNGYMQIKTTNHDISMDANGLVAVTSQLKVAQTEWKSGKAFTCKVSDKSLSAEVRKEISVCSACSSPPPNIQLEIPNSNTVTTGSVKVTCLVHTAFHAKVTWLLNGNIHEGRSRTQLRNETHLVVDVRVPLAKWSQLKTITCRVEHACFSPTEKTAKVAGPSVGRPQVEIRRSLSKLLKGESAVFQCDVSQLSPQDLFITFQVNGADTLQKDYIDLPEESGPYSVSRSFSVPTKSWKIDTNVSCRVNQGSSTFKSNLMSRIFVEPSVEVHPVPSEGSEQQILACSGWGFNPNIKWFNRSKEINPSNSDTSMNNNGHVAVMSQLHVDHAEWKRGVVFTCEVSDSSLRKNVKKDISICSVTPKSSHSVGVYIQRPKLEELQKRGRVTVTCLFVGTSLCDFSINWKVGDQEASPSNINMEIPVSHNNGTETLHSSLYVSAEDWHSNKQVSCEGKHLCSNKSYEDYIRKSTDLYRPVLRIMEPTFDELYKSDSIILTCLVSAFFPSDIIVQWRENGQQLPASLYVNSPSWKEPGRLYFSMRSRLNVTKAENNNSTYSCVVRHESSESPFETSISDVFASVSFTKPSAVLLQGENELMCLVSGFNPKSINITWFRSETTELSDYNTTEPYIGPDRKFRILSRLRLAPIDTLPGVIITCRVTHEGTTISVNMSKPDTLENCNFFDTIKDIDVSQDALKETWYMALTFLCFFLFTIIFSLVVLIIKTK
ncbi:uncharacterized protein ighd [Poeciliopsis prolifica]|uniref:uncharacterized protein ighd n=1 Tax=Poeciliopsis prolifica TaxID=188132 RepID=UPI002412E8C0|nr:uncharacterized protein ighd [Poeciliopsis prolifica]